MIDAVSRDGYVIAQEYLARRRGGRHPAVRDERSAAPLQGQVRGVPPRPHRRRHAIATSTPAASWRRPTIDDDALELAEIVRPKLVQDGMFLVGLDIVGDKLMEINVFSPGGLGSAQKLEGVNFTDAVIDALERKVDYMGFYRRTSTTSRWRRCERDGRGKGWIHRAATTRSSPPRSTPATTSAPTWPRPHGALATTDRRREEDPFTDRWTNLGGQPVVVAPLRFEFDLNRPREKAVYREPDDAWGLMVWDGEPSRRGGRRLAALYDAFYVELGALCDAWSSATATSCCSTCTPTTTVAAGRRAGRRPRARTPRSTSGPGASPRLRHLVDVMEGRAHRSTAGTSTCART